MKSFMTVTALWLLLAAMPAPSQTTIHVGYVPNITHPQALVGRANGGFEKALGSSVKIDWKTFNAGPSAIEALFAGAIDLLYVGPNPTITGYVRSHGEALRVVAGATSGGASLIVRGGANIHNAQDFHGKKVASPQLGNTQDVALRAWLKQNNLKTTDKGGDVQVIPTPNPDQLTLFQKGELDAAWAPEPWATRLVQEGGGQRLVDERTLWPNGQFIVTQVVVGTKFLKDHPDLVKKWLAQHVEVTEWINKNRAQATALLNQQIAQDTGRALPQQLVNTAFSEMETTYDPIRSSLLSCAQHAYDAGFMRQKPDLSNLYSLELLNEVLREKQLKTVQ